MTNISPLSSNSYSNHNDYTKEPENHLDVNDSKWFAIYTNYKREKTVKKDLDAKGIDCFLPIQKVIRNYASKRKTVELPLISCYLFVKIKKSEYVPVLETENVVKFVRFSKNLISIPEQEINILKQIIGEGIPIVAERTNMSKGDLVKIIGGNLTGLQGVLVEEHGEKEMIIDLERMGYSLRMQIDAKLLSKV